MIQCCYNCCDTLYVHCSEITDPHIMQYAYRGTGIQASSACPSLWEVQIINCSSAIICKWSQPRSLHRPVRPNFLYMKWQDVFSLPSVLKGLTLNPFNAEATFVQSTRTQSFLKTLFKPCHIGIQWISLAEYSQMRTYVPGF